MLKIRQTIAKQVQKILEFALKYYKSSALGLGVLLTAALPPFYYTFAALVAVCGVVYLCLNLSKIKRLAAVGYWFGFGFFASGFYWIGNALLVDIGQTGWLYVPVLLLNGAFFGIFTILPAIALKATKNDWQKVLLFAGVWGFAVEWLRSIFLTGFPWNPLSSIWAFSPAMLQTLSWWGTYGLSAVTILILALPAVWLKQQNIKASLGGLFSLLAIALMFFYGKVVINNIPTESDNRIIKVRLVQPSIPQVLKWNSEVLERNFAEYIKLSTIDDVNKVNFVIWGETASPFDLIYESAYSESARQAVPDNGYLISGFLRHVFNKSYYVPYNSMAVMDKDGVVVDVYDKSHLVPFGEYIPLRKYLPRWVRPLTNTIAEFGRGQKLQTIAVGEYAEFAPLICYEVIFSGQVAKKTEKPRWMVVLTNDGWYGISSGPYQHLVAAQMRAVEEGISVVRSANSGISAVINPYGFVTAELGLAEKGFIDAEVDVDLARDTLFGRYGNILSLLLCGLFILSGLFSFKKKIF